MCVKGVHSYQRGIPDICLLCSQPKERLVVFYLLFIRYTKREIYSLINNHLQQSSPPPLNFVSQESVQRGQYCTLRMKTRVRPPEGHVSLQNQKF